MSEEYQEAGGGGLYILKNGIQLGYIPPDHQRGEAVRKLASEGRIAILPAPVVVPPPAEKPELNVERLARILKKKGVIGQPDIDDELSLP